MALFGALASLYAGAGVAAVVLLPPCPVDVTVRLRLLGRTVMLLVVLVAVSGPRPGVADKVGTGVGFGGVLQLLSGSTDSSLQS